MPPGFGSLDCVLCHERISSVLDGTHCGTCGSPVHRRCFKPGATRPGMCAGCGADAASADEHRERAHRAANVREAGARSYHGNWGLIFLAVGVLLLAVGIATVLRAVTAVSEDRGFSLWYGAIVAGPGFMLRGVWHFRAARKAGGDQDRIQR